ncbi:hypothetical protein BHM03_00057433 [Ensete ventricosum]|nr:hypothetical protein BHM03_00057433 [Ensete ventricosum]
MFSFSSYISVVLHGLCTTRRTFSLYDQINLIDTVPEDQLRFQWYMFLPLTSQMLLIDAMEKFSHGYQSHYLSLAHPKQPVLSPTQTELYGDTGFTVNGVKYEGSLLVVEHKLMTWTPKTFSEITPESLSVFKILRPVPVFCFSEILILGCGRHIQPVSSQLQQFIRSTGMKLEAVDSRNAASTYNVLSEEGRPVAAALLPYGVAS